MKSTLTFVLMAMTAAPVLARSQRSLTDLSSAGGELSLGVRYRIDRHFLASVQ